MMKKEQIISATIIALGIVIMGLCLKGGMDNFTSRDRKVTVKGLAEEEVKADKVTWPIVSKELGDDLPMLYERIAAKQYSQQNQSYRYNVTLVITVTSTQVDKVRSIIARQGELLKQGVAIVADEYQNPVVYEYVSFKKMKPKMMTEAIENAEQTAKQFANNSHSTISKIISADQGQFSIDDRDANTPYIKRVRVVTTVTYALKD